MRRRASRIGRSFCLAGAAFGAVGLMGWIVGWPFLTTIMPGQPSMKPNTALALMLIGVAGALRRREAAGPLARTVAAFASLAVLAIGIATLVEYALGMGLGIDQALGAFPLDEAGPYPGRPSPLTALTLALLASAVLAFDAGRAGRARPAELLILCSLLITFVAFLGLLLGAGPLYRLRDAPVTGVAIPTAVSLILLCIGLLLERPDRGIMRVVLSGGPGGLMLRRLAIPAVLAPAVLGPVVVRVLATLGVQDAALELAALSIAMTAVTLLLLAATVPTLNRTHDTLEASRQRVRDLIEHAPDAVFVADLQGRYIEVNDAACRMLGYERRELLSKSIVDLTPPESAGRLAQEKEQLLAGSILVSEWNLRHRNGSFVPVEVSARILADGRWQGFVRDVTERKRLEGEQRMLSDLSAVLAVTLDLKATLRSVASIMVRDLADICIVATAKEGERVPRQRIAASRDPEKASAAEALAGMHLDLAAGSLMHGAREPLVVSALSEEYLDSLAIDEKRRRALRDLQADSLLALPLSAQGQGFGTLVLVRTKPRCQFDSRDVSLAYEVARRAALALENARLYRKAVEATQLRDELLGIVAHDLRNPLSALLVEVRLMRRRGAPERRSMEGVEAIEGCARRMTRLIDDLLDLTRIEAGRLTVDLSAVPVNRLLRDCTQTQRPLAVEKSLELRLEVEPDLPHVWGDYARLLQVLENLVGNAVKFAERGGVITLRATRVDKSIQLSVSDTGPGIPRNDLPHVFERFWQARRNARAGAGLGLQIVKGIVEAHGGSVWVESEPGRGSTFSLTIPVASALHARASLEPTDRTANA